MRRSGVRSSSTPPKILPQKNGPLSPAARGASRCCYFDVVPEPMPVLPAPAEPLPLAPAAACSCRHLARSSPSSVSHLALASVEPVLLVAPLAPTLVSDELERGAVVPAAPALSPLVPVEGGVEVEAGGCSWVLEVLLPEPMLEPEVCAKAENASSAAAVAAQRVFSFMKASPLQVGGTARRFTQAPCRSPNGERALQQRHQRARRQPLAPGARFQKCNQCSLLLRQAAVEVAFHHGGMDIAPAAYRGGIAELAGDRLDRQREVAPRLGLRAEAADALQGASGEQRAGPSAKVLARVVLPRDLLQVGVHVGRFDAPRFPGLVEVLDQLLARQVLHAPHDAC